MDKIIIRQLRMRCIIGVFQHERQHPQEVLADLILFLDLTKAGASDQLGDSVDYKALKFRILDYVESSSFNLIESLAEGIASLALADQRVVRVRVRVDKPGALSYARTVGVEIEREQE